MTIRSVPSGSRTLIRWTSIPHTLHLDGGPCLTDESPVISAVNRPEDHKGSCWRIARHLEMVSYSYRLSAALTSCFDDGCGISGR